MHRQRPVRNARRRLRRIRSIGRTLDNPPAYWPHPARKHDSGTAGFTAALALLQMQDNRQTPELGPIAITGASGGVGMLGIDIFSRAGYDVHAISGKTDHFDFLRELGAAQCIDRHGIEPSGKPMDGVRFGGALDNVGGAMLASLLPQIAPYGNVRYAAMPAASRSTARFCPLSFVE